MSQRYSGKSRKDSSTMKKSKLSPKEKRKLKRENKKKWLMNTEKNKMKRPSVTWRFWRSTTKKKLKV